MAEAKFEERYSPFTINGGHIEHGAAKNKRVYGYCHYKNHNGYLTKKMLEERDCINKECHYFEPNSEILEKNSDKEKLADKKKEYGKKIKKLWIDNEISGKMYMEFQGDIKRVDSIQDLYTIIEEHQKRIWAHKGAVEI